MANYLILVKHSLPEIKETLPAREWRLSQEGRSRAQRLALKLGPYQPDVIVSSVEPKAVETAEIIARQLKLGFQLVEGLHEHNRDQTPYLSSDQFEMAVHQLFLHPDSLVFGSETANEAHLRFSRAVQTISNSHQHKTAVVVSHGTVIALFVSRLMATPGFLLWKELGLPAFVVLNMHSNTLLTQENIV